MLMNRHNGQNANKLECCLRRSTSEMLLYWTGADYEREKPQFIIGATGMVGKQVLNTFISVICV